MNKFKREKERAWKSFLENSRLVLSGALLDVVKAAYLAGYVDGAAAGLVRVADKLKGLS